MSYSSPFADFVTTTITTGTLLTGATSTTIGSGLSIPDTQGVLQVDYDSASAVGASGGPETISYATYNSGTGALNGITRGIAGTTDVDHANGASVQCAPSAVYIEQFPTGTISMYGGSASPAGWLLCDGSAVSRTTYSDLFDIISTSYGVGDNSSTFNVPDMRGNVAAGVKSTDTDFHALGHAGGGKLHSHSGSFTSGGANANHRHSEYILAVSGSGIQAGGSFGLVNAGSTTGYMDTDHGHSTTVSFGSGTANSTLQPYVVVNYMIKT